jgi:succinate dehydrogenase / fumarate reductase flavoprotein subunit
MFPRTEMLDLIVVDGRARGIVVPRPGHRRDRARHAGDAVVLATGGYGNVFYLSTNAKGSNATAIWRAHKRGARTSPTPATRRSTRPASRSAATTSRSSR